MKKVVLSALVCAAVLTSCKSAAVQPGAVFDYQSKLGSVSGEWSENGEKYGVELYFDNADGVSVLRTLTFSSPETLQGITVSDGGDHVDISAGDMSIALENGNRDTLLRLKSLFSLDAADITDIQAGKQGTVIIGKSEGAAWQVETDDEGMPRQITYESEDFCCLFEVAALK